MVPITYEVVGEEDYALKISVAGNGEFVVESGTYTSHEPRKGKLTEVQESQLLDAIKALGLPREHPMPEGATAFEARLTVGAPGSAPASSSRRAASSSAASSSGLSRHSLDMPSVCSGVQAGRTCACS